MLQGGFFVRLFFAFMIKNNNLFVAIAFIRLALRWLIMNVAARKRRDEKKIFEMMS